jgi:hypothetical protein
VGAHPSNEEEAMQTLNWKVMTLSLALFSGLSFILCVAWGLAVPPGAHDARFLELTLPGFVWLTPGTFVLGLVETMVIGAYAGFVFTPIHNAVASPCR